VYLFCQNWRSEKFVIAESKSCRRVNMKHSPHEPRLTVALPHLKNLSGWALHGADVDSAAFKEFIREKNPQAATELLRAGETISTAD
jgi:hypothetical protein